MNGRTHPLEVIAAWLLALLWLAPLAYAFWSALHPAAYATSFSLSAPWTLENFARAVAEKKPLAIPGGDEEHNVAVLEAVLKSAETRKTVRVAGSKPRNRTVSTPSGPS